MQRASCVLGAALLMLGLGGCALNLVPASEPISLDTPWAGYECIRVRTCNGDVELLARDTPGIRITGVKRASGATLAEARANLERLAIVAEPDPDDPRVFVVRLDVPADLRHRSPGASLAVHVPQPCAADVVTGNGSVSVRDMKDRARLRTANGAITVENFDGVVEAATSNGQVRATNVTGSLEAETSNGAIFVRSVTGDCRLETSNGRIEVREAAGNVQAVSSNGAIDVAAAPPQEGQVVLETSNGRIRVELPANLRGVVSLHTSNGRIDTDFGSATLSNPRWSSRRFEAAINGGGAGRITAGTSNGSIVLVCR